MCNFLKYFIVMIVFGAMFAFICLVDHFPECLNWTFL